MGKTHSTHMKPLVEHDRAGRKRESPITTGLSKWPGAELNRRHADFQGTLSLEPRYTLGISRPRNTPVRRLQSVSDALP